MSRDRLADLEAEDAYRNRLIMYRDGIVPEEGKQRIHAMMLAGAKAADKSVNAITANQDWIRRALCLIMTPEQLQVVNDATDEIRRKAHDATLDSIKQHLDAKGKTSQTSNVSPD